MRRRNTSSRKRASCNVVAIDRILRKLYGDVPRRSTPLGNKSNPLDELVFIQLSVRTPEREYETIYRALRRLVGGKWERLLSVESERAIAVLQRGGMARMKVQRLGDSFRLLQSHFGRVTLAPLRPMSDTDAEALLVQLPGVGKKVARCVLLYSLDRDVFPVDTHCFRVLERLGLVPQRLTYRQAHDHLQSIIPKPVRRSLHVNLIRHGRAICTPHHPQCPECPLLHCCPTGKRRIGEMNVMTPG